MVIQTRMMKPKILIVDDSPENLQVLLHLLKKDYAIIAATTGEKALRLAAKDPVPDLILLDVVMPKMNGYEVYAQLKAQPQTEAIPTIFLTALSEIDRQAKELALGAIDYITKPVDPHKLKAQIERHLNK